MLRSPPKSSSDHASAPPDPEVPSAAGLRLFYLLFLGGLGTLTTYLPLALKARGLTLAQISTLLALPPLVRVFAPSIWGAIADRFRITGFLLRVAVWGALLTYLPVLVGGYVLTASSLMLHTFFRTPGSVLADTLAFRRVAASGGSYGALRAWGTVGYALVTLGGGYLAERLGPGWVVTSGAGLLLAAALVTHGLPRPSRRPSAPIGPALRSLVFRPTFLAFLIATALHTIGQATYDGFFPLHLERLGVRSHVIGWAIAVGATAEVGVMLISRRLLERFGAARVYAAASAVAVVRWTLNAAVTDPGWLIAVQTMHGITFGAWYVAAATWMDEHAPAEVRASAQGLLSVASFGLGGILAMGISGWVGSTFGTGTMFGVCAIWSGLACILMTAVSAREGASSPATVASRGEG
jgi:PPP family 3-phenylpropionic acid transporter